MPTINKQKIAQAVIMWANIVKRISRSKLKVFLIDNGGECVNETMKNWMRMNEIKHEVTATSTSQQNGKAERLNRTLFDMMHTCLSGLGILREH